MNKTKSIAATAANYRVNLTNEMGAIIKKSVLFYIDGRDDRGMISSFEREMIAEGAWFRVIERYAKYKPSKNAKFLTWAKKVAKNYASDELDKLQNDPLHMTGHLHEDQPRNENDAKKYNDAVSYRKSFGRVEDCSDQVYWRNALDALKDIVAEYSGRDRTVAELLIAEKSKAEIMAQTQMTGGNVDVCVSRVRKRMRADLLEAGYSLVAKASDALQSAGVSEASADFFVHGCKNSQQIPVRGSVTKTTIP